MVSIGCVGLLLSTLIRGFGCERRMVATGSLQTYVPSGKLTSMTNSVPSVTSGRIPQLDGIRGIAILLVLVWHFLVRTIIFPANLQNAYIMTLPIRFLRTTWSGVDLFFVLS